MADEDADRPGDGHGRSAPPPGMEHSISPGVPCPETVLVVVMADGSYLLVGHPWGKPTAFVACHDAGLLHRALETAFGNPADNPGGGPRVAG